MFSVGCAYYPYSLDVNATSSYDAAHLYLTHVKSNPAYGFPVPTTSTVFKIVTDGRILRVEGSRLKRWIENRRQEWKARGVFSFSSGLLSATDPCSSVDLLEENTLGKTSNAHADHPYGQ